MDRFGDVTKFTKSTYPIRDNNLLFQFKFLEKSAQKKCEKLVFLDFVRVDRHGKVVEKMDLD